METFENKMHLVNDLLYEKNMFLRLYEEKAKFRYLFQKDTIKTKFKERSHLVLKRGIVAFTLPDICVIKIDRLNLNQLI